MPHWEYLVVQELMGLEAAGTGFPVGPSVMVPESLSRALSPEVRLK